MSAATYAFLPWIRRGIATEIQMPAGNTTRASLSVSIALSTGAANVSAKATLPMIGPGDIGGFDPVAVIRTWPRPDVYDAASNYFPLIEFDQIDLPWRYTPKAPDANAQLLPWFCLISLERGSPGEFTIVNPDATRALAQLTVAKTAPLPKLSQAWAWAHVQVSGVATTDSSGQPKIDATDAGRLVKSEPHRLVARLLCPRHLKSKTPYMAFLVPAFRRGVLAGLGQDPGATPALDPAWSDAEAASGRTTNIVLPVYYQWGFQSGEQQDFEALVGSLKKGAPPGDAGKRMMDVTSPGLGRPAAASQPMGVEGALKVPGSNSTEWDRGERVAWIAGLKQLVDVPQSTSALPRLGPPIYGRWHAARRTLEQKPEPLVIEIPNPIGAPIRIELPALPWSWFDELNADPRLRIIAAMGVRIVQLQQEQLMASAWRQVEGIRAINAELKQAQFAREVARRIHVRHIAVADAEVVLQMTAPLHARVRETAATGQTMRARLRLPNSPLPPGVLAPQWRRTARPFGPAGRRQGRASGLRLSTMLARLNAGVLQLARPPASPARLSNLAGLQMRSGQNAVMAAELHSAAGGGPAYAVLEYRPADEARPGVPLETPPGGNDSSGGAAFRATIAATWGTLTSTPGPEVVNEVNLRNICRRLIEALDPNVTCAAVYAGRINAPQWDPADPLEPVMAAPQFPQPMVWPLMEQSQEWIFPGLDKVPPNSTTVLEINRRFIFAYMLGLNYEMARELLWHEYPTDQRGTYFRQFWDPAAYIVPPNQTLDRKKLEDIDPIDRWPLIADLQNAGKQGALSGNPLVLLIRGDLLARYPNMMVYAAQAQAGVSPRTPSTTEAHPVFSGTLKPDVSYFAFNLTKDQALGRTAPAEGWFFVLQEQPTETRFGLDAVSAGKAQADVKWDDLAWDDLGATVAQRVVPGAHIDVTQNAPKSSSVPTTVNNPDKASWGANGSDMALITLQRRVRVAIHASNLMTS